MNVCILPEFGNCPIGEISYLDVEEFKAGLEVSTKRINNVLVPMRSVFTMAFKEGIIRDNVMARVDNLRIEEPTFDALEWLAAMCSHVPNKGEQMVRYYGYYSNVCRGQRKKANEDGLVPSILQPDEPSKGYRKNWARLIQKIYEIDPLTCPKCHGPMALIAFIEAEDVIEKILKHLGLWELTPRPPPRMDCPGSQLPPSDSGTYHLTLM